MPDVFHIAIYVFGVFGFIATTALLLLVALSVFDEHRTRHQQALVAAPAAASAGEIERSFQDTVEIDVFDIHAQLAEIRALPETKETPQ